VKVVIAIDSFKGSMSSLMAGEAVSEGIKRVFPDTNTRIMPVADGGEGTVEALVAGLGGILREVEVCGPFSHPVKASYGVIGSVAVMEMSSAAGIALVPREELDPMRATTFGVGEMIKDAMLLGCRDFLIGIGGSATNDGGVGMLSALGFEFLDKDGQSVPRGARGLREIFEIRDENVPPELFECTFNIACDVKNPLCGALGCSRIFAPQKGAREADIELMDGYMRHYALITREKYPEADEEKAGAGAAGGLGFAFASYLRATLRSGIELILDKIGIESEIADADLVITGEGRIDAQTVMGKAPVGIAALAKKHAKPVIAFCGCATRDSRVCNSHGIDAIFPILRAPSTLDEAMNAENARNNMADTAEQVIRLFMLGR